MNKEQSEKIIIQEEEKDLNIYEEVRGLFLDLFKKIIRWIKPKPDSSFFLKVIIFLLKLPFIILLALLSPIAFIILFITFVVLL